KVVCNPCSLANSISQTESFPPDAEIIIACVISFCSMTLLNEGKMDLKLLSSAKIAAFCEKRIKPVLYALPDPTTKGREKSLTLNAGGGFFAKKPSVCKT